MRLSNEHATALGIQSARCPCGAAIGWLSSEPRPACPRCGERGEGKAMATATAEQPKQHPEPQPIEGGIVSWTAHIRGWHPAALNQLMKSPWVAAKLKKDDKRVVGKWLAALPRAAGKRRLTLTITLAPRQRAVDPDGWWKSLLDALVYHGFLRDDNRQSVELMPVEFERREGKATTLRIEEIG